MSEYQHYLWANFPKIWWLCFECAKLGRQHWFDYVLRRSRR